MESIAKQNPITKNPAKSSAGIRLQMVLRRSLSEQAFPQPQAHTAAARTVLPIAAAVLLPLKIEIASEAVMPSNAPRIYFAGGEFMGGFF